MDSKLKSNIETYYFSEYYQSVLQEKQGLVASYLRWERKAEERAPFNVSIVAGLLIATVVGLVVSAIIPVANIGLLAGMISFLSQGSINVRESLSIAKVADANIEKDILNGTLPARYKTEVLDKQLVTISEHSKAISELSAKADFATATAPAANEVTAPVSAPDVAPKA